MSRSARLVPNYYVPPSSKRVILNWTGSLSATEAAAGTGVSHFYRLNSAYDVDTGLGSTSMPGFAEWSTFFLNYKVHRVRTKVSIMGATGTTTNAMLRAIVFPVAYQAVIPANAAVWPSQYLARSKMIAPVAVGGANRAVFDEVHDIARILRVTKEQYRTDMDFSGQINANPARMAFLCVALVSLYSSTPATMIGDISVTMECEFFNPVPLST